MRKRFSAVTIHFSIFLLFCGLLNFSIRAQSSQPFSINESPLPAPTSPVMDYAGVIDAATKEAIEKKIIQFRDSTDPKVELAVAIVETTGDRPIFDYSLAVSRGWKIGSPEQDNPGALLFIAVNDRKYFTQVSKDLEDELPDGVVGQLQRQNLVPAFRQQNYGKGVSDTIDAYITTIRNKGNAEVAPPAGTTQPTREKRNSFSLTAFFCCLIVLFLVILPLIASFNKKKKRGGGGDDNWRGGGFGGGASDALPWIVGSVIANSIGNSSSSSSSDWGGSSGGSDWGGFGGGGDFGGGGAGGDW